jgi:hypothetical protein
MHNLPGVDCFLLTPSLSPMNHGQELFLEPAIDKTRDSAPARRVHPCVNDRHGKLIIRCLYQFNAGVGRPSKGAQHVVATNAKIEQ